MTRQEELHCAQEQQLLIVVIPCSLHETGLLHNGPIKNSEQDPEKG